MITARYTRLSALLIRRLMLRPQLQSAFSSVFVGRASTHSAADSIAKETPIIFYCNHCSWWDGHLIDQLNQEQFGRETYTMMEDRQLSKYAFLRYIGCFSVNRTNIRTSLESMTYAAACLTKPNRALLIFPQGEILAHDIRPLKFFQGLARIISMVPQVACIPVAIRLDFLNEQRPTAWIAVGQPRLIAGPVHDSRPGLKALTAELEALLTKTLDDLSSDIRDRRFTSFRLSLVGRPGIDQLWDSFRGKLHKLSAPRIF